MSETTALFDTLRSSADQTVVASIESVVRDGTRPAIMPYQCRELYRRT